VANKMRIRTVKPEFWQSEDLATVSAEAVMLAVGVLNLADDEGYFKANPKLIEAAIFPIRDLSTTCRRLIGELSSIGYLDIYKGTDGKDYGHVVKFLDHQRIDRPKDSKIKPLCVSKVESTIDRRLIADATAQERKGTGNREQGTGKGMEANSPPSNILDQADESEHDIPTELSGKPLSDEQLWQGVVTEDWYKAIHKVAHIGAKSWNKWQDILEHTFSNNLDELVTFCRSYPGECWPDDIKKAYIKKNPQVTDDQEAVEF